MCGNSIISSMLSSPDWSDLRLGVTLEAILGRTDSILLLYLKKIKKQIYNRNKNKATSNLKLAELTVLKSVLKNCVYVHTKHLKMGS